MGAPSQNLIRRSRSTYGSRLLFLSPCNPLSSAHPLASLPSLSAFPPPFSFVNTKRQIVGKAGVLRTFYGVFPRWCRAERSISSSPYPLSGGEILLMNTLLLPLSLTNFCNTLRPRRPFACLLPSVEPCYVFFGFFFLSCLRACSLGPKAASRAGLERSSEFLASVCLPRQQLFERRTALRRFRQAPSDPIEQWTFTRHSTKISRHCGLIFISHHSFIFASLFASLIEDAGWEGVLFCFFAV